VVAFASVAGQLSFRVIVHLAVFAGECGVHLEHVVTRLYCAAWCTAQPRYTALVVAEV
jgi:hypothetical protein